LTVRLLVTRPEPDAERTAAALRARGHVVVATPLLRIEAVEDADIGGGPWAAILVTSANAARGIAGHSRLSELRALPVLAVGKRSARAMRAAGFADVSSAAGGADDLTRLAAERLKKGAPLLYLAGADRSGDIAGDLTAQNFVVRTAVIYRAVAADGLPHSAADALASGLDGVVHFSRRSAEAYVNATLGAGLAEQALKKATHFCLSAQVAEPLAQAGAADIRIAREPAEAALLALIPTA
jgi:uroporphyrinogen-III synthase